MPDGSCDAIDGLPFRREHARVVVAHSAGLEPSGREAPCLAALLNGLGLRRSSTTILPGQTGQRQRCRRSTLWGAACQCPANCTNSGSAAVLLSVPPPHDGNAAECRGIPTTAGVHRDVAGP